MNIADIIYDPFFIIIMILFATSLIVIGIWIYTYVVVARNINNHNYLSSKMEIKFYNDFMNKIRNK